jgi:cytoskeletal protein CcmA (bactofilin family)
MWKKDDPQNAVPNSPPSDKPFQPTEPVRPMSSSPERAAIGRSITIKGEVTGDEDLLIQGQVNGSVDLKNQAVTVGKEGRVKADISGRMVTVEGEVEGNLNADEQIILRGSAKVQGDITAPRVVLEDGAVFRGGIDMGDPVSRPSSTSASSSAAKTSSGSAKPGMEASKAIDGTGKDSADGPDKAKS